MSTRDDLAQAASSVEGLTGHPYYVQGTDPGHTFVRLDRIAYPNPFGGIAHYNVVMVLPQDLDAAERYVEHHLPLLVEALAPHLVITEAVMQRLNITGVGDLPCVFVNGRREAD